MSQDIRKRELENETGFTSTKKFNSHHHSQSRNREVSTIIVTNLPKSYNQQKTRNIFHDCGNIIHIDLVATLDNSSKIARLEFESYNDVLIAQTKTFKKIGQNEIIVKPLVDSTIWITNFPPTFEVSDIRSIFKENNILPLSIRFPSLRFNSKRRFCYVDVCSNKEALLAVSRFNDKNIHGYKLVAKLSNPAMKQERSDSAIKEKREILVRNIDNELATEEILKTYFLVCGEIQNIRIISPNNKSNSFAFIIFLNAESAEKAIKLNNSYLKVGSNPISITIAEQKPYLERQEIKSLLSARHSDKISRTVSLHPIISDKISKEKITAFVLKIIPTVSQDDLDKVYLVTDYSGCLIVCKSETIAAKLMMGLNGQRFQNNVIHCGTIHDLKNSNKDHHTNKTPISNNLKDIDTSTTSVNLQRVTSEEKGTMTNEDFRKMFLGK
ncbi:hypothetical protein TBLA_0B03120 [Henningerozyma blattae CBS 6284]|uniref:RRM domain-containing protein n=1 Tax=Henningerozyma blattae (strain ATCC 34711 / CBS 6284 / DSM 70876 / NBRC 10599 / NRRL Y-10934 / UCD 77-7) TaxID=1071380 RepID=I2GYF1_HENB6|nr:hypothetical protein TBLA_0B03120 [Tetrapisispora blattae CBS 6284]CCH59153.1 hypothetical protein TBLA_0B03120 [Tetrapisispora blattae CBS 6284]